MNYLNKKNVNPHATPVDIGITIKPFPVRNKVKELDVVATIANVSSDFKVVVNIFVLFIFLF